MLKKKHLHKVYTKIHSAKTKINENYMKLLKALMLFFGKVLNVNSILIR